MNANKFLFFTTGFRGSAVARLRIPLAICLLSVLCTGAFGETIDFTTASKRAEQHEKSLSPDQLRQLTSAQGTVAGPVLAGCIGSVGQPGKMPKFAVVMRLDSAGVIQETWIDGLNPVGECFRKQLAGKPLFRPPFSPFMTIFDLQ